MMSQRKQCFTFSGWLTVALSISFTCMVVLINCVGNDTTLYKQLSEFCLYLPVLLYLKAGQGQLKRNNMIGFSPHGGATLTRGAAAFLTPAAKF